MKCGHMAGIERRLAEARESGDRRREELLDDLARERREQLDSLPPDLAGRMGDLQSYDWMDDDARQAFEELTDELRRQLLDSMFSQLQQGLSEMDPEQLARTKDMLAELNNMLEQRERGEEPDFDGFMERYGDMFPGNPQTLDELLEQMAASMARMQQMLNDVAQYKPNAGASQYFAFGYAQSWAMDQILDRLGWSKPLDKGTGRIRRGRGVAIGFKGGVAIAEAGLAKVWLPACAAMLLGALIPLWTYPLLRFGGKLSAVDAAANVARAEQRATKRR